MVIQMLAFIILVLRLGDIAYTSTEIFPTLEAAQTYLVHSVTGFHREVPIREHDCAVTSDLSLNLKRYYLGNMRTEQGHLTEYWAHGINLPSQVALRTVVSPTGQGQVQVQHSASWGQR